MAGIGKALWNHLKANVGVTTALGSGGADKIYASAPPQNPTYPFIVYTLVTEPREYCLTTETAQNSTVQIDCWGKTYDQSNIVADAVQVALDFYRGSFGGIVTALSTLRRSRQDLYEDATFEHRVSLDYSILWRD